MQLYFKYYPVDCGDQNVRAVVRSLDAEIFGADAWSEGFLNVMLHKCRVVVAFDASVAVGFALVDCSERADGLWWITNFGVRSCVRGVGVGARLLLAVELMVRTERACGLGLECDGAVAGFYERYGYMFARTDGDGRIVLKKWW